MSPGRSHKPLFEHLAKGRAESVDSGGPSRLPRGDGPSPRAGRVSLSYVGLYGIIAAGVLLAVACWSIGYRVGFGRGEDAWAAGGGGGERTYPVDPLNAGGGDGGTVGVPEKPEERTGGGARPAEAVGRVLTARGPVDRDPRQEGYNYLELATLNRAQVEDAVAFLAGEGVAAIGVLEVDSGGGGANNPVRYRLVSIEVAIPGEQFRVMRAQRLEHEGLIERLGRVWQKEHKGASDFSSPLWKRYP